MKETCLEDLGSVTLFDSALQAKTGLGKCPVLRKSECETTFGYQWMDPE